jgi:hypothetical protein
MTAFTFAPATREQAKARIAFQGPAGSGKTKTALRIAEGLAKGGQIGVIDTERGSALTYAPVPGRPDLGGHVFGHLPMDTHDPRKLIEAVREAERAGITVLIVDSWSHFWNGRGGLLEIVEQAGRAPGAGGTFGGWRTGNPIEQDMLDALLNFRGHLIVTMRTKGDYAIEQGPRGPVVKKLGVKAIQRDGAEYELGLIIDMVQGTGTITKTRYEPLEGLEIHHPGEELAEVILEQLGQGIDPVQVIMDELVAPGLTYQAALELHVRAKLRQLLSAGVLDPADGSPTTLGELIVARGRAVKPAAVPAIPPSARPDAGQSPQQPDRSAPSSDASPSAGASAPQMRRIHAVLGQVGITEREERHTVLGALIGRQISTANELTRDEAGTVIDSLDAALRQPDPAAFLRSTVERTARADAARANAA